VAISLFNYKLDGAEMTSSGICSLVDDSLGPGTAVAGPGDLVSHHLKQRRVVLWIVEQSFKLWIPLQGPVVRTVTQFVDVETCG
jgi:hypothetical protein